MTIHERLTEWKRLAEAATPGPWHRLPNFLNAITIQSANGRIVAEASSECLSAEQEYSNGDFIADARTGWPRSNRALEVAVTWIRRCQENGISDAKESLQEIAAILEGKER